MLSTAEQPPQGDADRFDEDDDCYLDLSDDSDHAACALADSVSVDMQPLW